MSGLCKCAFVWAPLEKTINVLQRLLNYIIAQLIRLRDHNDNINNIYMLMVQLIRLRDHNDNSNNIYMLIVQCLMQLNGPLRCMNNQLA